MNEQDNIEDKSSRIRAVKMTVEYFAEKPLVDSKVIADTINMFYTFITNKQTNT